MNVYRTARHRKFVSRRIFENCRMWHPRSWRNWKTRPAQTRVPYTGMQVQLLPSALSDRR